MKNGSTKFAILSLVIVSICVGLIIFFSTRFSTTNQNQNTQSNINVCDNKITISHNGLTHTFTIKYNVGCTRYLGSTSTHFSAGQSETLETFYQNMPIATAMSSGDSWYKVIFD